MPAESSKQPDRNKKFFFDRHVFNEDGVDLTVLNTTVAPSYTDADLAAAKAEAHAQGKKEGIAEANASREQYIARTLDALSLNFSKLFSAEQLRESVYEKESVRLALTMIEKIFPELNKRLGQKELSAAISQVLHSVSGKSEVTIEVPPDTVEDIQALLARQWPDAENAPAFRVLGNDKMETGTGRLVWSDGGAVRDPKALIAQMQKQLEALLPKEKTALPETQNNAITEQGPGESGEQP